MNTASPDDIDISALWQSLRRSVPKLLALSLAAGIAAYVILSFVTPEYSSEAQIQLVAPKRDAQTSDAASAEAVAARMDKEAINTHVRALMSPDLAVEVINAEGLAKKPEFNSALQPPTLVGRVMHAFDFGHSTETEQERVLRAYFDRLDVYSPKESRFIGIRFTSADPKLAAAVANKLAEVYRVSLATRTVAETDEVQQALQPKIDKLMKEVAEAEAAVEKFRGDANIFKGGPNDTGLNQQQLADLNAELTKAQAARGEAEARAAAARDMVRAGNAELLPEIQKSPLIQNLVQQRVRLERQLSELSATLLPAHPRMRQIQADLEGLQRQIKTEVGKIVEGIEKGAQAAALREATAKKSLDDMKFRVVGSGGDQVKLRQLEALAKSKRQELEQLQARFEANRGRADSQAVPIEAQIITSARPSSVPSFPKKLPYSALVAVAFLLFGIAIVVTRALFAAARTPASLPRGTWQGAPGYTGAQAKTARTGTERAAAVSAGVVDPVELGCGAGDPASDPTPGHRRVPHADHRRDGRRRCWRCGRRSRQGVGGSRCRRDARRLEPGWARRRRDDRRADAARPRGSLAGQGALRGRRRTRSRQRRAPDPGGDQCKRGSFARSRSGEPGARRARFRLRPHRRRRPEPSRTRAV